MRIVTVRLGQVIQLEGEVFSWTNSTTPCRKETSLRRHHSWWIYHNMYECGFAIENIMIRRNLYAFTCPGISIEGKRSWRIMKMCFLRQFTNWKNHENKHQRLPPLLFWILWPITHQKAWKNKNLVSRFQMQNFYSSFASLLKSTPCLVLYEFWCHTYDLVEPNISAIGSSPKADLRTVVLPIPASIWLP